MTTENRSTRERSGPSIHVIRARKLLLGGLVGGLGATVICLIAFSIAFGLSGLGSSALAAAMVLFFYAAGQLVMVRFADAGARTLLLVSMFSYTARVIILGLILLLFNSHRTRWTAIQPTALFITTVGVVAGWLIVEVLVFRRLRIDAFDGGYDDTDHAAGDGAGGEAEDRSDQVDRAVATSVPHPEEKR